MNDPELAAEIGSVMARRLDDGRIVTINKMTFNKYRVTVGTNKLAYDDGW